MAPAAGTESTILKVLSGVQSGVEVVLSSGEYLVGAGPDDDIQLIDISLKAGHLRIRLSPGKIEVAGASGSLRTNAGLVIGANGDWQVIEPLDIVTAGTTRFALGAPSANWSTIADEPGDDAGQTSSGARRPAGRSGKVDRGSGSRRLVAREGIGRYAWPAAALAGILLVSLWFGLFGGAEGRWGARPVVRDDLQATRTAVSGLTFANQIEIRQDVDGQVFVTGYVETPAERRAVVSAIEATAVPARIRIWVLQTLRAEIENLIRSEKVNITTSISPRGVLTLEGLILNEATAKRITDLVRDQVLGIAEIDSRIRTARTLLADVERLARVSQINPLVLFRLDGELIEANGAIPVEKVDSWVGFLQAYSQRFAQDIALRSLVQLQNVTLQAGNTAPVQAIAIGNARPGDTALDLERLRRGAYNLNDVFAGLRTEVSAQETPAPQAAVASANGVVRDLLRDAPGARQGAAAAAPVAPGTTAETRELQEAARRLVEEWRDGRFEGGGASGPVLKRAMDALAAGMLRGDPSATLSASERSNLAERLLPLFADPRRSEAAAARRCWADSRLTYDNVGTALFWLDLASVSETLTIRSLGADMQDLTLEAALSPERTAQCVSAAQAARPGIRLPDVYLTEVKRNPSFVRYITRDMPTVSLDISGVSVGANRFLQMRSGQKMPEGAAPDAGSRIALVGELGAAVQRKDGFGTVLFGPEVNWIAIQ